MSIKCSANEQIKRKYYYYLEHADGKAEATIKQVVIALGRFETFTRYADFRTFTQKQAVAFKECMAEQAFSLSTVLGTVKKVQHFLRWLSLQAGYKSRVKGEAIEFMNLSEKMVRAASAPKDRDFPSLAMVEAAIDRMPFEAAIEKRNRAIMALSAMTAIRVTALTTLHLKHYDRRRRLILQLPDQVETKNSKRIDTYLMPVCDRFETIFLDWLDYLERVELYGPGDPMFPATQIGQDINFQFQPVGLKRAHWKQSGSVRQIIKEAFEAADLPTFTPHSFRNMLVSEMYRRKVSIPAFKAGSQNLGHKSVLTTLTSYGKISLEEQGELIREAFAAPVEGEDGDAPVTMAELKAILKREGLG